MIEFRGAYPGDYDPETGRINRLRIELGDMTPTEMDWILSKIKELCHKPVKAKNGIDDAVMASNTVEYPKEKAVNKEKAEKMEKTAKKAERSKARSLHAKTAEGILEYLRKNGGGKKDDIKDSIFPGVTSKDKEYFTFHASFHSLQKKEKIRRVNPTDQESDWILGE